MYRISQHLTKFTIKTGYSKVRKRFHEYKTDYDIHSVLLNHKNEHIIIASAALILNKRRKSQGETSLSCSQSPATQAAVQILYDVHQRAGSILCQISLLLADPGTISKVAVFSEEGPISHKIFDFMTAGFISRHADYCRYDKLPRQIIVSGLFLYRLFYRFQQNPRVP